MKLLLCLLLVSSVAYPCNNCEPKPQPKPQPQPVIPNKIKKMVKMINAERKSRGLKPLKIDPKLNCAAEMHSKDVGPKKLCQHQGTDGSSPWDRAKKCGTNARAENIACGQRTPRAAVDAWLNSPGHFKNMMNKNLEYIGVGENNFYWTNIFR